MKFTYFICLFLIIATSYIQNTNGSPSDNRNIIIDIATKQIEKLISLVESLVNKALKELAAITQAATRITSTAITAAVNSINLVIDFAVDSVGKIARDAIDSGINATECYVINVDNLNIIRRRLIGEEVLCATDQLAQFNSIINNTMQNFNNDLALVAGLPKRLAECMTSLHMIRCVTELTADVTQLSIDIPKQIMEAMKDVTFQMTGFEKDVHQCQFKELREAIEGSRKIVDGMRYCVREANQTQSNINY